MTIKVYEVSRGGGTRIVREQAEIKPLESIEPTHQFPACQCPACAEPAR